jgi:hypothetical protein
MVRHLFVSMAEEFREKPAAGGIRGIAAGRGSHDIGVGTGREVTCASRTGPAVVTFLSAPGRFPRRYRKAVASAVAGG